MHARLREPVLGQEILRPVLNSIGIVLVRLVELSLDMVRAGYVVAALGTDLLDLNITICFLKSNNITKNDKNDNVVAALGMNLLDLHIIIIIFVRFFVDLGVVKGLHREL